jgi:hypothetical protein
MVRLLWRAISLLQDAVSRDGQPDAGANLESDLNRDDPLH